MNYKKIIVLAISMLLLNGTTTREIIIAEQDDSVLASKTIIVHAKDRSFLFYNVQRNAAGLSGIITSRLPFSNKSTELHPYLEPDMSLPEKFPAEYTVALFRDNKK